MRRAAGAGFSSVLPVLPVARVLLLAQLCLAGDCVDGVTPDCSDAATQCGPDLVDAGADAPAANEASTDAAPDSRPANDDAGGAPDASTDADASDQ